MNLHAVDLPDEPAALPAWLEGHLVGPHLAALVAELRAVHGGAADDGPFLGTILGEHREAVLAEGLMALPPEALRELLRHPARLLELQTLVLTHGGRYWDDLASSSADWALPVERGRRRLEEFLNAGNGSGWEVSAAPAPAPEQWWRRPWLVSLATAAAVLLAVFLYQTVGPPSRQGPAVADGWGWSKPGALPETDAPGEYLNALAAAAEQWFNKRPDEPAALARRITEFRAGCSTLLLAEHRPLSEETQDWLRKRCRAWADKLDAHLRALEAGEDPLRVREEVDQTVRQLVQALRTQAEQVGGPASANTA